VNSLALARGELRQSEIDRLRALPTHALGQTPADRSGLHPGRAPIALVVAAIGGTILGNRQGVDISLATIGLKVFPVVILGGLDSITGAIVAGIAGVQSGWKRPR